MKSLKNEFKLADDKGTDPHKKYGSLWIPSDFLDREELFSPYGSLSDPVV